jgi:hypothetical protein
VKNSGEGRCSPAAAHLVALKLLNLIPCESSFEHAFALRLLRPVLRARLQVVRVPLHFLDDVLRLNLAIDATECVVY